MGGLFAISGLFGVVFAVRQ
ncbi:MAG: hypothetical protein HQ498_02865 [Pseudohongiella sp.]|nr:hypothetical protein [Pseudohongiella sp.]